MMRIAIVLGLLLALMMIVAPGCGNDDDDDDGGGTHDCTEPLQFFYDCGYAVTFDDIETVTYEEAWDSCQTGYGRMWRDFVHCYRNSETCEGLADCLPEHGFVTQDDTQDQTEG